MLLCFVPYLNVIFLVFAFLWIPHSIVLFSKMRQLRRENEVYARVVGKASVVIIAILLVLFSLAWTAGVTAGVVALVMLHKHR